MSVIVIAVIALVLLCITFLLFISRDQGPVERTPQEVAAILKSAVNETIDFGTWDYFECCEIANPKLESIRQKVLEATEYGSPNIKSAGKDEGFLTEQGKEFFNDLIKECLELSN